ncbi:MAG: glycosyltransferase family 2 protein [Candidatus Nealsonbacteria bacterium]
MKKSYLDIFRASDLQNKRERVIYRLFEVLPGFLSWGTLILAVTLSWLAPATAAIFIIVFDFIWFLRITYLSVHQISSYRRMKKTLKTDWMGELNSLSKDDWRRIYHLVILPVYKEGREIIVPTIKALLDSEYPKEKIIVVLAIEERGGKETLNNALSIKNEFEGKFFKFLVTLHPKDILGEIAGKGSNVAFALKEAKEKIIDPLNIPYQDIMVSNFDIDTRPYPQYFSVLTWHYLTTEKPLRSSYQPVPVYDNNIWDVPAFSRLIATSGTFWQMMQQERREQLVTYSAHSLPFSVLEEVGYPANLVPDDSHIFWKAYLKYNGDYRVVPLYYPVSMDAVMSKTLFKTILNQYKQQRRWAWGCSEMPYIFFGFLKNKSIKFSEKLRHSLVILDGFWSWSVSAIIIFLLGWLPLTLGGRDFQTTLLSYNLPKTTSYIMTASMIGMVVSAILSLLLLPPKPKKYGFFKNLSILLQWFLLPITLIFFGAFPSLEAQMRLLLGKHLGFWVTEKYKN